MESHAKAMQKPTRTIRPKRMLHYSQGSDRLHMSTSELSQQKVQSNRLDLSIMNFAFVSSKSHALTEEK